MTWILIITSIIIIAIVSVPLVIKGRLNAALNRINGFAGQVEQLRLNLFTGKIYLYRISIRRESAPQPHQFLANIPGIIVSFHWKYLFKGILDLDIVVHRPELFFVDEQTSEPEPPESRSDDELLNLKESIEKLVPFCVTLEVRNGKIDYMNSNPAVMMNASMSNIQLIISDFSNRLAQTDACKIRFNGSLLEGNAVVDARLFPLHRELTFDLNIAVKSINLVLLNNLFKNYANVDLNKGTLDLYGEVAVADNAFKGYVKPILKELDFIGVADKDDTIFQKLWERIVAISIQILKNHKNGQVATRIPIEGRLDDPHVDVKKAIAGVLKNAIVKAFRPSLDNVINVRSIWQSVRSHTTGLALKIADKLQGSKKTTS